MTHANNSDTDDDGLKDGNEVLFIPRPFQEKTHPLLNDTDFDGMLDGWEMQVQSQEDNTNHNLIAMGSACKRTTSDLVAFQTSEINMNQV